MTRVQLHEQSLLRIVSPNTKESPPAFIWDLDELLGNANGHFEPGGVRFTASARKVSIQGLVIRAELRTLRGDWRYDEIAVILEQSGSSERPELSFDASPLEVERAWKDEQSFASLCASPRDDCRNVRLTGGDRVTALCRVSGEGPASLGGEYERRHIELNTCLGACNGRFTERGHDFTRSARNVRLNGALLTAELRTADRQWQSASICLSRVLRCEAGQLLAVGSDNVPVVKPNGNELPEELIPPEDMASTSAVQYPPLPKPSKSLRLCSIHPGTWNEPVKCSMSVQDVDQSQYHCLSYCWGDAKDRSVMMVGDRRVVVQRSLAKALRYIRARGIRTPLWIDAICINQQDNAEKSEQVARMAEIYSQAEQVLVWLGDGRLPSAPLEGVADIQITSGVDGFADAIDTLSQGRGMSSLWDFADVSTIAIGKDGDFDLGGDTQRLVSGLDSFIQSPWFTRTWTVQEYVLAKEPIFLFGRRAITWQKLESAHRATDQHLRSRTPDQAKTDRRRNERWPASAALEASWRAFIRAFWQIKYLRTYYGMMQEAQSKASGLARVHALQLLSHGRFNSSSDPRDKLFGFYSIARGAFTTLKPDYDMTAVDVYSSFTYGDISAMRSFDIWLLEVAERGPDDNTSLSDLPSWVVDWTCTISGSLQSTRRLVYCAEQPKFGMAPSDSGPIAWLGSQGTLIVQAVECSQLLRLSESHYVSLDSYMHSNTDWDEMTWNQHSRVLREWTKFMRPKQQEWESAHAQADANLTLLWKVMVGPLIALREDGDVSDKGVGASPEELEEIYRSKKLFMDWWARHQREWPGLQRGRQLEEQRMGYLMARCRDRAGYRRLGATTDGGLALVPRGAREGDCVFKVRGSRWPVVLRSYGAGEEEKRYRLVGPCIAEAPEMGTGHAEDGIPENLSEIVLC